MSDLMELVHMYHRALSKENEYMMFQSLLAQFIRERYSLVIANVYPGYVIRKPKNGDGDSEELYRNESYLTCMSWLFTYIKDQGE